MSTLKVRVSINGTNSDYRVQSGISTSTLAAQRQFREDFSLGDNITVLVNGEETSRSIREGDVLSVRTNASRKAAARTRVTVNVNGASESWFVPTSARTARDLAANSEFRDAFGLGSNITVLVNGTESSATLATGDVISVRTNASAKA